MQIWSSFDDVPDDLGPTVVTIGNFDGVHLGHQHVLQQARATADELGVAKVVASPSTRTRSRCYAPSTRRRP